MLWGAPAYLGPYVAYELERVDFYRGVLRTERWTHDEIEALSLHDIVRLAEIVLVKAGVAIPAPPTLPEEEQLRIVMRFGG